MRSLILLSLVCACANNTNTSDDAGTKNIGGGSCEKRWVLEGDVTNARDLGGHPLGEGKTIACSKIFRGGHLTSLSASGCDELTKLNIQTVIDVRMDSAQSSDPAASCVSAQVVDATMPKLLPDTPANYLALLDETAAVKSVFAALGQESAYPVYMHCVIGRDRASFVTALVMLALGASRTTVVSEFNLSAEANIAVKPECIEAVLDAIDQRGGIESYLQSAGVTSAELTTLRERAITE